LLPGFVAAGSFLTPSLNLDDLAYYAGRNHVRRRLSVASNLNDIALRRIEQRSQLAFGFGRSHGDHRGTSKTCSK